MSIFRLVFAGDRSIDWAYEATKL